MKLIQTPRRRAFLLSLLFPVLFAGCVNPTWPKDSYITNADVQVNTPWGSVKQHADVISTGTAARNASKPEPEAKK